MTRLDLSMRKTGFALLMTVFLIALLTATGVGVSMTAMTENINTQRASRNLQHSLAVDSLLACLPAALEHPQPGASVGSEEPAARRVHLEIGPCRVDALVRDEAPKWQPPPGLSPEQAMGELKALASANGLAAENLRIRPIVEENRESSSPTFVWFDQFVERSGFEDVFRWDFPGPDEEHVEPKKCWSDAVTFWGDASGEVVSIEVRTRIGDDSRQWYLVASIENDEARELYRGIVE